MSKSWRERCLDNPNTNFVNSLRWARLRAKKKGLLFELTLKEIKDLFDLQNGECHYSGIKMNVVKEDETKVHDPYKMTIDRIIPELGYVANNIVWCAYCINVMKQKMSLEKMVDVCESICKRSSKILGK